MKRTRSLICAFAKQSETALSHCKNAFVRIKDTTPYFLSMLIVLFCMNLGAQEHGAISQNHGSFISSNLEDELSHGTKNPGQGTIVQIVSFYHLRVELKTTSNSTKLLLPDNRKILTLQYIKTDGAVRNKGISMHAFWIEQEHEAAEAHHEISITIDLAVAANIVNESIQFRLEKAKLNESSVTIYVMDGNTPHLLQKSKCSGNGSISFLLDTSRLKSNVSLYRALLNPPHPRLLLAFYYMWYSSMDIWSSPELIDHPLIPYVSSDETAIARQIEEAKSAGINGFIASWWGPGSDSDHNFAKLLSLAQNKYFKVSIYLEIINYDSKWNPVVRSQEEITEWLHYAISNYGNHPAFLKMNGKPLIAIYVSRLVPAETWIKIFDTLRQSNLDAAYIADFGNQDAQLDCLTAFDGMHTYTIMDLMKTPDEFQNLEHAYAALGQAVRYYSLLSASLPKIWIATVQPGFDDHLIPGRKNPALSRKNGIIYSEVFNAAADSEPDFIFITSWNEWWENTYIEPGETYGNTYLDDTRQNVIQWRAEQITNSFSF